jgi:hypothetical protein
VEGPPWLRRVARITLQQDVAEGLVDCNCREWTAILGKDWVSKSTRWMVVCMENSRECTTSLGKALLQRALC